MRRALGVAAASFACLLLLGVTPAQAHEARKVGAYDFDVGWGDEPAYSGFKNSVVLFLNDAKTARPVVDLGDTLEVEVKFGAQSTRLRFESNFEVGEFGTPGDYRAWLIPTRAGQYSFHITGSVKGQKIDQTFTSGEKTFDNLIEPTDVQFPAKDPSNAQLSDKIDRGLTRIDSDAQAARSKASTASTIGYIGIVLGAVALILGLVAKTTRPKTAA